MAGKGSSDGDAPTSIDEAMEFIGFGRFQIKIFFLVGFGNFVEAMEISFLGVLLPALKSYWEGTTNLHLAAIMSSTFFGMLLGAVFLGRLSDRVGRRLVFQLSLFVSAFFGVLSALAPDIYTFMALRWALGIGYGGNIVTDITLLAELLPIRNRGFYLAFMDVFFGVGALMSVAISWLVIPNLGWRAMVAFSTIPAFLLFIFRRNVPESPRYLLMVRRVDDARQVLAEIARFNALPEARVKVIENMDLRSETNLPEQLTSLTFDYALLVKPPLRHLTVPLVLVWFFNSLASCFFIWVPLYISENSKNISGASEHLFLADGFGVGTLMAMGDLAGALLLCSSVEFADRKMLMRLGLAALALLLAGLGVWNVAPVLLTLLPVSTAVRSVVLTLLYTYTPEVFPTLIRTTALGLCSSFHRLAPVIGHLLAALAYTNSFALMALASSALYVAALIASLLLPYESRNAPLGDAFHREVVQQRHDE